jgi:ferritin-like protein
MPIPNIYAKILIAIALLLISFGSGFYLEHLRFADYRDKVVADGKVQEQKNQDLLKEQKLINQQLQTDYENKIANIKQSYASSLHNTSPSSMSYIPNTTIRTDDKTSVLVLAEQCAETTQQLVSLQSWINEQVGIK